MIHHRDGIRPRPIDDQKSYFVIKDLTEAKLSSNKEGQTELCNIEKELYKVLEYYDKIRKKQIPKSKIINEKNSKNENKINYNINNNIIYINENNESSNQNSNEYILNYKLSEYQRPENYIIYSSSEKNKINETTKIYEAKEADKMFLNFHDNFMKIGDLENILIDLENNTTNEKDDKISEESARKIIEQKYPKYKKYMDSIITHFKDRRISNKKSLIRGKWRKNKSTDKYLTTTFRKRERDKIKTRKNNQNKEESLSKIIEAELFCKKFLLPLMNDLGVKEKLNKDLLKLEKNIFLSECDKIKKKEISPNRIKENNIIKEVIEKNVKSINKKNDINKVVKTKMDIGLKNGITGNKIINHNGSDNMSRDDENNINKSTNENRPLNNNSEDNTIDNGNKKQKQGGYNKNNLKKNGDVFPSLSLNSLLNKNISLNEANNNDYVIDKKNNLRVRIRINRINKIAVDRYIQRKNDFNPFHDSYNDVIINYKKYDNDQYQYLGQKNFENLFNAYNLNFTKNLNLINDSDEDSIEANNDLKHFSNSYKQFLKLKKAHSSNN